VLLSLPQIIVYNVSIFFCFERKQKFKKNVKTRFNSLKKLYTNVENVYVNKNKTATIALWKSKPMVLSEQLLFIENNTVNVFLDRVYCINTVMKAIWAMQPLLLSYMYVHGHPLYSHVHLHARLGRINFHVLYNEG